MITMSSAFSKSKIPAPISGISSGTFLQMLRKQTGKGEKEFAEAVGLSRHTLRAIEIGQKSWDSLTNEILKNLAKTLGMEHHELILRHDLWVREKNLIAESNFQKPDFEFPLADGISISMLTGPQLPYSLAKITFDAQRALTQQHGPATKFSTWIVLEGCLMARIHGKEKLGKPGSVFYLDCNFQYEISNTSLGITKAVALVIAQPSFIGIRN